MTVPSRFADPGRIVVAGDWHANTDWAVKVIRDAAALLAAQEHRVILHLGDFGIWPGRSGRDYLAAVDEALASSGVTLLFADGNHEDHARLADLQETADRRWPPDDPVPVTGSLRLCWLRRGTRWAWHGRTWLALGGAVSLDRAIRTEGKDWWPQEEITDAQERAVTAAGHADVMVTHDCPARVWHSWPPPPSFWDLRDLARSDAHRERLQRIVCKVRPSWLVHGHLHREYQRITGFGYGPVQVTGLGCDGAPGNYAVLDTAAMTWERGDGKLWSP